MKLKLKKFNFYIPGVTKVLVFGILMGVILGVTALVFDFFLKFLEGVFSVESISKEKSLFLPIIASAGGIVSGLLTYFWAKEAAGHGTDGVIDAFHFKESNVNKNVPIVKFFASSFVLGTGGSAGKEGPIAQIGAGIGSFIGKLLKLPPKMRRTLLIIGMGAGIGTIFRAPFGGALFSVEVLYRDMDMELEGFIPSLIGAIIGYSIFGFFTSFKPIFHVPYYSFENPFIFLFFVFLGVFLGLFLPIYVKLFYSIHSFFNNLDIPFYFKPAIGGFLLGLLGIFFPYVLGPGYNFLQDIIDNNIPLGLLLLLPFLKILSTGFTVGSGGSGGVFAPTLFIGGAIGGIFGNLLHMLFPHLNIEVYPFVVVGMAGFVSAACKTPIAGLMMVLEMTGGYSFLVPALLAIVFSFVVSGRRTIYVKQVKDRLDSPVHFGEYALSVLENKKIYEISSLLVEPEFISIKANLVEIMKKFSRTHTHILCVKDEKGEFKGIITLEDVRKVMLDRELLKEILIAHDILIRDERFFLKEDDSLKSALLKFIETGLDELPVVYSKDNRVKILNRRAIFIAHLGNL